MAPKKKDENADPNQNKYIAEKEYEFAISLIQYHIQLLWSQFGTFFLAETVIIAFLGNAITEKNPQYEFIIIGSILGFIICFPWWTTFIHNYQYYLLRMAQARQHELILGINLLTQGKSMSEGCLVTIGNDTFQHSLFAQSLSPRRAIKLLIILFGGVFVTLIVFSILQVI